MTNYLCDLSILPKLEAAKGTSKKEEAKMCGLCTSGEVAVGYCQDCGEYLCSYCQDMHNKSKNVCYSQNRFNGSNLVDN